MSLDLVGGVAFEQCVSSRWVVGVRHTPEEFVKLAAQAGHPFHLETGVPHVLRDCMDAVATMSPADVASHRCKKLSLWLQWAKELNGAERDCKAAMSVERRGILAPKRLKLLDCIIKAEGFPDANLASELETGFDLAGDMPLSHHLPPKFKPADLSVEALKSGASKARAAVRQSTRSSGDPAMDQALWDPHRGREGMAGGPNGVGDTDRDGGRVEEVSSAARAEGTPYRRLLDELDQRYCDAVGAANGRHH